MTGASVYGVFSGLIDQASTLYIIAAGRQRAFSRTSPGAPPSLESLLERVAAGPARIRWPNERPRRRTRIPIEIPFLGQETFLDFLPATRLADTLLVYHHGLGEPHDITPVTIRLSRRLRERCDIAALKGLGHKSIQDVGELIADRDDLIDALLASASAARAVIEDRRAHYRHAALVGISLGGVITLIAASQQAPYDLFLPLVAGPDLRDLSLHSLFTTVLSQAWVRRAREAVWADRLDLTPLLAAPEGAPIRPLLGQHDQLFRHGAQVAAYARVPRARVTSVPGGHITVAARTRIVVRHVLGQLDEVCWA